MSSSWPLVALFSLISLFAGMRLERSRWRHHCRNNARRISLITSAMERAFIDAERDAVKLTDARKHRPPMSLN